MVGAPCGCCRRSFCCPPAKCHSYDTRPAFHKTPGKEVNCMYFVIRCDAVPGKLQELDSWLKDRAIPFWTRQAGIKSFHTYSDALVGYPERTLMIEVQDLASLQRILKSNEHTEFRNEFLKYGSDVQSQILEPTFQS